MRITMWSLLAACLAGMMISPAQAENWFQRCKTAYHRNVAWPEPFIYPDREAVLAPFDVMVAKGWQRQNTLAADHFDDEKGALVEAGRRKVDAILTRTPPAHRVIYVERGATYAATEARVMAVKTAMRPYFPADPDPQVNVSILPAPGPPGSYTSDLYTKFRDTTPSPRLPAPTQSGLEQ